MTHPKARLKWVVTEGQLHGHASVPFAALGQSYPLPEGWEDLLLTTLTRIDARGDGRFGSTRSLAYSEQDGERGAVRFAFLVVDPGGDERRRPGDATEEEHRILRKVITQLRVRLRTQIANDRAAPRPSPRERGGESDSPSSSGELAAVQDQPASPAAPTPTTARFECPNPRCDNQVPEGSVECWNCRWRFHPQLVPCPDCGTPNRLVLDDEDRPCAGDCGSHLSAVQLLGLLPERERFDRVVPLLRAFSAFEMDTQPPGDEVRFRFRTATSGTWAEAWLLNDGGEAARAFPKRAQDLDVLDRIRHPIDVETVRTEGEEGSLCTYRHRPGSRLDPAAGLDARALSSELMELARQLNGAGYSLAAVRSEHLLWDDESGRVVYQLGHRLQRDRGQVNSDLLRQVARIWYETATGQRLGIEQPRRGRWESPRHWLPDLDPRVWVGLSRCLADADGHLPKSPAWVLDAIEPVPTPPDLCFEVASHDHVGKKPEPVEQQDACTAVRSADGSAALLVVADGVSQGGWGRRASRIVLDEVIRDFPLDASHGEATAEIRARLDRANARIGEEILAAEGARDAGQFTEDNMSSTAAVVLARGDSASVVTIGD